MSGYDKVASFDLGSNTLRALSMDCDSGRRIADFEKIVRTADGLLRSGKIGDETLERVVSAIEEAKRAIDFESLRRYRAVTTEAVRKASNGREFISAIEERTSILFDIVSGEEEALLTLKAVGRRLERLGYTDMGYLMADIGGGSTEIAIVEADGSYISRSFPIGIVTAVQRHPDPKSLRESIREDMSDMERFITENLSALPRESVFVATAGTPTTVSALKLGMDYTTYDPQKINGTILTPEDLESIHTRLSAMEPEERDRAVGTGRGDLISAGIYIYMHLFDMGGFDRCIVVDDGLREGVAESLCEESG